jgi:hypothetical protein
MIIELNGYSIDLTLHAARHGRWVSLPLDGSGRGARFTHNDLSGELVFDRHNDRINYSIDMLASQRTRLRLSARLLNETDLFHLIPGNIHGDNNAAHVRPGEFPCLTATPSPLRNHAKLWEFRADRASHPVSILCCKSGAIGVSIDPYSEDMEAEEGFIRNGVFAAVPDVCGVSVGYGNDPLTFSEKTDFLPATTDYTHGTSARGQIFAIRGGGRAAAHQIIRALYEQLHQRPEYRKTHEEALRALADAFINVNWSPELQQYTNRHWDVPTDLTPKPWRAVVEIGWTGGSMLAYPFSLAERLFPDLKFPKGSAQIFDEICSGYNEASGFINDTAMNRFTKDRPQGWNDSEINGWWSGFLSQTRDNHCAYTNAHAAYYITRLAWVTQRGSSKQQKTWLETALKVLDTAIELQRSDGAFGYIFSSREQKVVDWEGFAGCWFVPAIIYAWQLTNETRYRNAASKAMDFYAPFVRDLAAWGSPMDTFKSIDSEGNLAFIRAARLMHQFTGEDRYLQMLLDGANYEYLWRYGFRTRPQCPPLKGSSWNSCGGSLTSVSNPHIHPMSVVATDDLSYLSRMAKDGYHQSRADDGVAWLMNTMELYPDVTGYGPYGVLSERTCPSDGLLAERYTNDGSPASTWWSYNAWAAGSAMEALAEQILSARLSRSAGDSRKTV